MVMQAPESLDIVTQIESPSGSQNSPDANKSLSWKKEVSDKDMDHASPNAFCFGSMRGMSTLHGIPGEVPGADVRSESLPDVALLAVSPSTIIDGKVIKRNEAQDLTNKPSIDEMSLLLGSRVFSNSDSESHEGKGEEVKEDPGTVVFDDPYDELDLWLRNNSVAFPDLTLRCYSEGERGVHASSVIPRGATVLSVPLKCLITDKMGRTATVIGRKLFSSVCSFSAANLIAVVVYILTTRRDPSNFFQPYYKTLPKTYSNFPIFWGNEKLYWLKGSRVLNELWQRKKNMRADYNEVCRVCPEFESFSYDEFLEVRTAVGSRNFGISVNGEKLTAMVPFADMLNHHRPRQTSWAFENSTQAFTIKSLSTIEEGQQVLDSYGKKCNSRFFLHYGFTVERNREANGRCQNEVSVIFSLSQNNETKQDETDRLTSKHLAIGSAASGGIHSSSSSPALVDHAGKSTMRSESLQHECAKRNALKSEESTFLFNEKSFLLSTHLGCALTRDGVIKEFKISMHLDDRGTKEALSFVRIEVATREEIDNLLNVRRGKELEVISTDLNEDSFSRLKIPSVKHFSSGTGFDGLDFDFHRFRGDRGFGIPFISMENEARALARLAERCRTQLRGYLLTREENLRLLDSMEAGRFSDRRTAAILILGEQEICHFWIRVSEVFCPIFLRNTATSLASALLELPRNTELERDLARVAQTYLELGIANK